MYLNENQDVLYMINAIISRLKREHKESNINIKQVINTPNNNYQVDIENISTLFLDDPIIIQET